MNEMSWVNVVVRQSFKGRQLEVSETNKWEAWPKLNPTIQCHRNNQRPQFCAHCQPLEISRCDCEIFCRLDLADYFTWSPHSQLCVWWTHPSWKWRRPIEVFISFMCHCEPGVNPTQDWTSNIYYKQRKTFLTCSDNWNILHVPAQFA